MQELDAILKAAGEDFGLELSLDESGACAFELDDGRTLMLQERAGVGELDFVASLGPVPAEARADVFERLLEANFYWRETFGATISWNSALEEAVLVYPLPLADATAESVKNILERFIDLQGVWAEKLAGMVALAAEESAAEDGDGGEEDDGAGVTPAPRPDSGDNVVIIDG